MSPPRPAETASEEAPFAPFAPADRRRHGLYATPPEIVGYLVRSVHDLLKHRLGKPAGLADPSVRLLDPAAGPMTFVLAACREALAEHRRWCGDRGVAALVREGHGEIFFEPTSGNVHVSHLAPGEYRACLVPQALLLAAHQSGWTLPLGLCASGLLPSGGTLRLVLPRESGSAR